MRTEYASALNRPGMRLPAAETRSRQAATPVFRRRPAPAPDTPDARPAAGRAIRNGEHIADGAFNLPQLGGWPGAVARAPLQAMGAAERWVGTHSDELEWLGTAALGLATTAGMAGFGAWLAHGLGAAVEPFNHALVGQHRHGAHGVLLGPAADDQHRIMTNTMLAGAAAAVLAMYRYAGGLPNVGRRINDVLALGDNLRVRPALAHIIPPFIA